MKQYIIDELRPMDYEAVRTYLEENFGGSGVENVYWIPMAEEYLTGIQKDHEDCRPFYFAIELLPEKLCCELLVRPKSRVRCSCIAYADEKQRNWIIDCVDAIFEKLNIIT